MRRILSQYVPGCPLSSREGGERDATQPPFIYVHKPRSSVLGHSSVYFFGVHKPGISCVNVKIRIAYIDSYIRTEFPSSAIALYILTIAVDPCGVGDVLISLSIGVTFITPLFSSGQLQTSSRWQSALTAALCCSYKYDYVLLSCCILNENIVRYDTDRQEKKLVHIKNRYVRQLTIYQVSYTYHSCPEI